MQTDMDRTVTAAFAGERDADYAMSLIANSGDISVAYTKQTSYTAQGDPAMVILEATLADPRQASRVEMLMTGAHGVRLDPEGHAARYASSLAS